MSYFDQILGGSIPLNVIESLKGFQNDFRLNNQYKHLQLNEEMVNEVGNAPLNMTKLFDSPYGSHIKASLELDREKVLMGIYKLLDVASNDALNRNRNELSALTSLTNTKEEDKKVINKVINQFCADLSNSIILLMNDIKMDEQMKIILINIVHLTGITNKSIEELRDIEKKITLLLELPQDFKNKTRIHICETLKQILTPENIKKCEKDLIRKCIFDNQFLLNLSHVLVQSLENILGNIMNLTKYDRICYFYAFSVELSNAIANTTLSEPKSPKSPLPKKIDTKIGAKIDAKTRVIENFGVSIGNTDINVDTTKIKDIKEIEKNIDQSKVISGMNKMLSNAINNAASKNQADLLKAIAASNKINIGKVRGSEFVFDNISQSAKVDTTTEASFVQKIANKVINDVSVSLKQQVDMVQKESIKDMNKTSIDEKIGSSVGDVLTGIAGVWGQTVGKLADAAADILSVNIGNKTEKRTEKDITQQLKDKFNLNQSFQFRDDNDIVNKLENLLKSENLAKCAEDTKAGNEVNFGEIDVTGPVRISNVKQEAVVTSVMKCIFNQDVMNDISNKMINSQEKLIKQLIENVNDKLTDTQKKQIQGDMYAAGTAASAMISSAGTAAKDLGSGISEASQGLGKGISDASQGVGKGVGSAAEGVGKGIGSVLGGLTAPLIVGAIILVLLIIGYIIFKKMKSSSDDDDDEDE